MVHLFISLPVAMRRGRGPEQVTRVRDFPRTPSWSSHLLGGACIKMPHSCVYCGKTNAFKSQSALEKHLAFCSEVPGKKKKKSQLGHQVSAGLLRRVSDASPCSQQKRARYQNEDSHGSANKDNDNHGEGPSQPQDYNMMTDEVDILLVSTKQIFDST
jgi:hypothetical protein